MKTSIVIILATTMAASAQSFTATTINLDNNDISVTTGYVDPQPKQVSDLDAAIAVTKQAIKEWEDYSHQQKMEDFAERQTKALEKLSGDAD